MMDEAHVEYIVDRNGQNITKNTKHREGAPPGVPQRRTDLNLLIVLLVIVQNHRVATVRKSAGIIHHHQGNVPLLYVLQKGLLGR